MILPPFWMKLMWMCSAGHHCAQPLLAHLGVMVTTRASISFYNTEEDVQRLVTQLKKIRRLMGYDE